MENDLVFVKHTMDQPLTEELMEERDKAGLCIYCGTFLEYPEESVCDDCQTAEALKIQELRRRCDETLEADAEQKLEEARENLYKAKANIRHGEYNPQYEWKEIKAEPKPQLVSDLLEEKMAPLEEQLREEHKRMLAEDIAGLNKRYPDDVVFPRHYTQGEIQPITVIEDWRLNYHLGNALKYIARCEHKGNKVQDLEKAIWYLQREIDNE
jgi:hypothetical protein